MSVIAFGKQLWERDSDVFVFMARKAACFFDCLRELKIADVRGLAVSDRVLDMDLAFLRGKRVTLVDDCVFSGTTIYNAKTAVTAAGASSCDTMTISVNREWLRPELLPGGAEASDLNFVEPLLQLSDAQSVQQCYDIVRAISIFPRPYDVDFPHSFAVKKSEADLGKLLTTSGWPAYEVSSQFQVKHDVRVFTILPSSQAADAAFGHISGLRQLVQAAKVRVYARRNAKGVWLVRFVPMTVLGALPARALLSDAVWGDGFDAQLRDFGATSAKSRFRLLQFLASSALFRAYVADVEHSVSGSLDMRMREDLARMSFGSKYDAFLPIATEQFEEIRLPAGTREPESPTMAGFPKTQRGTARDPISLAAEAVRPFTWLYKTLEIPAREAVRAEGLSHSQDEARGDLARLRRGFSFSRLQTLLESKGVDASKYMSIYLDKIIDLGIAVPTIVEDDSILYRAFRHGEDAVFGEAEERLTTLALQAYMEARGLNAVFGLELQKFIVLFTQIAIRNGNLFERLTTSDAVNVGCQVLSVKGYLHGPVPTIVRVDGSGSVGAPYLTGGTNQPSWLVSAWQKRGILMADPGGLSLFSITDISDPRAFVQRFVEPGDAIATLVTPQLSARSRELLAQIKDPQPSADLLKQLIADLNAISERSDIWTALQKVSSPKGELARQLMAATTRTKPARSRLNRLILEEALQKELVRHGRGNRYIVQTAPNLEIGQRREAQARKIGRCLGKVVGANHPLGRRPLNNDSDLVLLSTCTEADHQVRALAGEISVLVENWTDVMNNVRKVTRAKSESDPVDALRSSIIFIGSSSGVMKFGWFRDNKLPKLLNQVARYCREIDSTGELADEWAMYWPEAASPKLTGVDPGVTRHINLMGAWLTSANILLRAFDLWLALTSGKRKTNSKAITSRTDDLHQLLSDLARLEAANDLPLKDVFSRLAVQLHNPSEHALSEICKDGANIFSRTGLSECRQLLCDSSLMCDSLGAVGEFIQFNYAVYLEVQKERVAGHFPAFLRPLIATFSSEDARELEPSENPWRTGTWIVLRGGRNSTSAASICARFSEYCAREKLQYRAVLLGQLAYADSLRMMRGNTKLAQGDFPQRISTLRTILLPKVFDNSIVCAYDVASAGEPEDRKLHAMIRTVTASNPSHVASADRDLPERIFSMTKLVPESDVLPLIPTLGRSEDLAAEEIRGSVHIGVITIREDEYEAVLSRHTNWQRVIGSAGNFQLTRFRVGTAEISMAVARCADQGEQPALALAASMLRDLAPEWMFVVGIAGAFPHEDYSLGDVLVSHRMHDFSVGAALEDKKMEFEDMGGPMALQVETLVSELKGVQQRLGHWNSVESVGVRPRISLPDPDGDELYGNDRSWKARVTASLTTNFSVAREPIFRAVVMISGNTLLKSTGLAKQWLENARQSAGVEMELAGVARAARTSGLQHVKVMPIRGISDIVGYKRSAVWSKFACTSAAAFLDGLVRSGLLSFDRVVVGPIDKPSTPRPTDSPAA